MTYQKEIKLKPGTNEFKTGNRNLMKEFKCQSSDLN